MNTKFGVGELLSRSMDRVLLGRWLASEGCSRQEERASPYNRRIEDAALCNTMCRRLDSPLSLSIVSRAKMREALAQTASVAVTVFAVSSMLSVGLAYTIRE